MSWRVLTIGADCAKPAVWRLGGWLLLAVLADPATADPLPGIPPGPRAELPVKLQSVEEEGGRLTYSIPVAFAGKSVEAVLATASPLTEILPGWLPADQTKPANQTFDLTFASGENYRGNVVEAKASLGQVTAPARFGIVESAQCSPLMPSCPIIDEPVADSRFGYNTLPATVGFAPAGRAENLPMPLRLGAVRYLLTAPRMGESEPGRLILNPAEAETANFTPLVKDAVPGAPAGAIRGCLRNLANKIFFCGAVLFDSTQSGVNVYQEADRPENRNWMAGDPARLEFTDAAGTVIANADFTVGRSVPLFVRFGSPMRGGQPIIAVGQLPYAAFRVLADVETGELRVAPRAQGPDGLVGRTP